MLTYLRPLFRSLVLICAFTLISFSHTMAQKNAVVQVHADKTSGYGVAYGGPQNLPDRIVTALHVVAGKSTILVQWQGKEAKAQIEKIYKPADLALLKLVTPLGIPALTLFPGEPPMDTDINFWEVPLNAKAATAYTTQIEIQTPLSRINPRLDPAGLSKSLCLDGGQYYPAMATEVLNFKEPNIRKSHSGSPLTYGDKIIGLVDGGTKLVDGKPCVWAIPANEFTNLYNKGSALPSTLKSCGGTTGNAFMYSGTRSDNPLLSSNDASLAAQFETSINFKTGAGTDLSLHHDYRIPFYEIWETLFPEAKSDLEGILEFEEQISINDMYEIPIDIYLEEETGISVMTPSQCHLNVTSDQSQTFITSTSPGGTIKMLFYISTNNTMEEGIENMQAFKEAMTEMGHVMDVMRDDITDFRDDPDNPYYSEYVENTLMDANGDITGEFFADLIINDGDFLAITISISDWNQLENNQEERKFLYLMETCGLLSDFAIY